MPIDTLIANAGRLRILTALVSQNPMEFVQLRRVTSLTDGNLSSHAKRLHTAGLLNIDKVFRMGKPVTTFTLTASGKERLTAHVTALMAMVTGEPEQSSSTPAAEAHAVEYSAQVEEDWVD